MRAKKSDLLLERGSLNADWAPGRWASSSPAALHLPRRNLNQKPEDYLDLPVLNPLERIMVELAREEIPREAVGALFKDAEGKITLRGFRNLSVGMSRFRIPDRDVIALHKKNRDEPGSVWAIWHSHPGGMIVPSQRDCAAHPPFARHLIIVCPREADVLYYHRKSDEAQGAA